VRANATSLYGDIETDEERVDHLLKLREVQDETGGFQTYIPLAFHPENTPMQHLPATTGFQDIKNIWSTEQAGGAAGAGGWPSPSNLGWPSAPNNAAPSAPQSTPAMPISTGGERL